MATQIYFQLNSADIQSFLFFLTLQHCIGFALH